MNVSDGIEPLPSTNRQKHPFSSIAERNRTVGRIIELISKRDSFLLLGHVFPDEDCIASLVSMALLIKKFGKDVSIYLANPIPDQLGYLSNICYYNSISLHIGEEATVHPCDIVCVLDTPKPDMVCVHPSLLPLLEGKPCPSEEERPIVEFDHHLSADAEYSGSPGYRFVHRATSTCELLALFCSKLEARKELLERFDVHNLFSRNIVLSMLTGMIGDTKNGLTLKTNRDTFFYNLFTARFSRILETSLRKNTENYSSTQDIFKTLQLLTVVEKDVYKDLVDRAKYSGRTGYVALSARESADYLDKVDSNTFIRAIKSVTDHLAERSGSIGLTAYYDPPAVSDLVQFRIRASRDVTGMDLRTILTDFSISDGGGHPGAIGFRVPKSRIEDLDRFLIRLIERLERL
jgi:nanoRNase/pAp phosphatase (c-di-AMP/oligoRNAs hydrolase)